MSSLFSDWTSAISLIFGGCCTNAITLEQITSRYPASGSIVTFFQFLVISLHGLPKFLIWTRYGPRFRPRSIPLLVYFAQVILFYLVSVLNNAAFAYHIPMAVHIIFRSGGLVVTMILGWFISNKRYNKTQIGAVILVTAGVVLTTLSANSSSKSTTTITTVDPYIYTQGILILILALILSGFLGILQDWAQTKRRGRSTSKKSHPLTSDPDAPAPWQEAMFYLHFLALPLFFPLLPGLAVQMHELNMRGPRADFSIPIPLSLSSNSTSILLPACSATGSCLPIHIFPRSNDDTSFLSITNSPNDSTQHPFLLSFSIPHIYLPLVLNTLTQLLCIAGVNRLTTRVSALTVNLVLVIRKALSLVISVVGVEKMGEGVKKLWVDSLGPFFNMLVGAEDEESLKVAGIDVGVLMSGIGRAFFGDTSSKRPQAVNIRTMCFGAGMVLLGTLCYALGSRKGGTVSSKGKAKEE